MNKISEDESLYIYEIITGMKFIKEIGGNRLTQFKIFRHLYEQINYECTTTELRDICYLSPARCGAMARQMQEAGLVFFKTVNGKNFLVLTDDIIGKARYVSASGYLKPLNMESIFSEYACSDKDFDVERIKNDKKELIKYLKNVVNLETVIYTYKKRYQTLYNLRYDAIVNGLKDQEQIQIEINKKLFDKKEELNNFKENIPVKPTLKESSIVTSINEPQKPELKCEKPLEPVYQKAGLFNKRKVNEENIRLKVEFEQRMKIYEQALAKYESECQEYDGKMEEFQKKLKEELDKEDKINRRNYHYELKAYEESMQTYWDTLKVKEEEVEKAQFDIEVEVMSGTDNWLMRQNIDIEMQFIEESIKDAVQALQKLYSYGVVYGKYRNYIAVATFCDYLMSGRCETLEGIGGAYNLYEEETRSNLVIAKLDKIIYSLEQIKQNQYYIYSEIKTSNERLKKIENQLVAANNMQKESLVQLKQICKNTEGISEQLNEIAFNTEVTAFYSKQTKELTDALGYMIALG